MHTNSIRCYHQIKSEGLLPRRRFEVYEALYRYRPATGAEFVRKAGLTSSPNDVRSRLSELERQGVVHSTRNKVCDVTGKHTCLWEVAARLPVPLERKNKLLTKPVRGKIEYLTDTHILTVRSAKPEVTPDWIVFDGVLFAPVKPNIGG